jgi:hypothetical protein
MSGNAAHTQQAILRGLEDLLDADANAPSPILVGGLQEQLAGDVGTPSRSCARRSRASRAGAVSSRTRRAVACRSATAIRS